VNRPDVPVIIITGYPSTESKHISMQRGASDYIHKPFTPEKITEAVKKVTYKNQPVDEPLPSEMMAKPEAVEVPYEVVRPIAWELTPGPPHFLDEAWLRQCRDGQVCLGAFLPRMHGAQIDSVKLPRVGDVVRRGLPLAATMIKGEGCWMIPSPVSGTVTEVHRALNANPEVLWREPFSSGWIARVRPDRLGDDMTSLETRRVILMAGDEKQASGLKIRLVNLGCDVQVTDTSFEPVRMDEPCILLVDASTCGEDGAQAIVSIKATRPDLKVVVLGNGDAKLEALYRSRGIFYYALEPFEDMEIADILFDAFRAQVETAEEMPTTMLLPEFVSRLHTTNRRGRKVSVLIGQGLLSRHRGLGQRLIDGILTKYCPLESTATARPSEPGKAEILSEVAECDTLLVIRAADGHMVPGSISNEPMRVKSGTTIIEMHIEPEYSRGLPMSFDERTTAALADYILGMIM